MSLLRAALKKQGSKDASKRDTASVKSAGARSLVASLYSLTIGGERVKKRRRPDFSTLGAPEWFHDEPPLPADMPGTARRSGDELPAYTIAHGTVLPMRVEDKHHWLSLVLYNHASETSPASMYHNEAKIAGEVRMFLEKTKSISSIDVWMYATAPTGGMVALQANVWNRHKGSPLRPGGPPELFKDKFPTGTFVFPFELPPLPKFVPVTHPDNDTRKNRGLVPLPPSGKVRFTCGVGVRRDSVAGINEDMDMILQYIPLCRPLPLPKTTPFPYLTSHEEWPLKRESVGGWVLSPFGGRGRVGTSMVEVEGLLGVQDPAVVTAGQTLKFVVLLWSKNADAVQFLGTPDAVNVGFYQADFLPSSEALRPREQSRQTRTMQGVGLGRIWDAEVGPPADGALTIGESKKTAQDEFGGLGMDAFGLIGGASRSSNGTPPSPTSMKTRSAASRMQSVWSAESEGAEESDGENDLPGLPADGFDDGPDYTTRLEGDIRIPPCRPVSYRYTELGREYSLQLQFTSRFWAHISPTGPGLVAEVPLWYVVDRPLRGGPAALNDDPAYLAQLPFKGATIPLGEGAVRWPKTVGEQAKEGRGGKAKLGQPFEGLLPPKGVAGPVGEEGVMEVGAGF